MTGEAIRSGIDPTSGMNLEAILAEALKPVDPPEKLSKRFEDTLAKITDAAASELSDWANELSDGELEALRDPRNWVRPVVAAAAGGAATGALLLFELRRRRKPTGLRALTDDLRSRL